MVSQVTGVGSANRITGLCPLVRPVVEVVDGSVCRAEIIPGEWPRTVDPDRLPPSRRVEVVTPARLLMFATVRFMKIGGHIYASARPVDQVYGEEVYGEDFMKSGAFPQESEVEAERLALESL